MEADNSMSFKEIDVKDLFYDKNPKLARWIPGFVYRYLRRIAHQDLINEIIRDYGHLKGYDFSVAMLEYWKQPTTPGADWMDMLPWPY